MERCNNVSVEDMVCASVQDMVCASVQDMVCAIVKREYMLAKRASTMGCWQYDKKNVLPREKCL